MAGAIVQKTSTQPAPGTTTAVAYATQNLTAGNLLVCIVHSTINLSGATCADSTNGAWTKAVSVLNTVSGTSCSYEFFFANTAGGVKPTVTVTWGGTCGTPDMRIYEISGCATSSPQQATGSNSGAQTTGNVSLAVTATAAAFILDGFSNDSGGFNGTAGTGFSSAQFISGYGDQDDFQNVSSAATYTDTVLNPGGEWSGVIVAYNLAGGGSVNFSGTGAVHVTGVTNLPAAIPQMTGTVLVTGVTNLPAAIPQMTGNVAVTGLMNVALAPQMTGTVLVTGTTNLPAAIPQLTGSWGVTGTLIPAIGVPLTGSVLVTGVGPVFSIAPQMTGNIFVTGVTSLSGLSLTATPWGVTGLLSLILTPLQINNLLGSLSLSGNLILSYQSATQPVIVPVTGIYITLTVDNSYWIVYLIAGVDYSTWIKTVLSGPYAAIGRTMAYDVAVQTLYAQIGSDS